jgi:hypothetical protein
MPDTERPSPRISVNKLGEYLVAKAARRRRILEDAKRPPDFIAPRYRDFYEAAPRYLSSSPLDDNIIATSIDSIQSKPVGSEWDEQNKVLNTDLLTNLLDIPDLLEVERYTVVELPEAPLTMTIGAVEVSVRPELQLTFTLRGRDLAGAIKLYTPKSFPLNQESGDYISTMVHRYCAQTYVGDFEVDYRHCYVVDVPSKEVYTAPRSYSRRMSDIEAACHEIAVLWPQI